MILLQAWVFLIVIYPNLGVIAADNLTKLPQEQLAKQKAAAFQPYEAEEKKVDEAFNQGVHKGGGEQGDRVRSIELETLRADSNHQVDEEFGRKLTSQMILARTISSLSPAVLFDQAAERYARTGMTEYERFMREVYHYWQQHAARARLMYVDRDAYKKAPPSNFEWSEDRRAKPWPRHGCHGCSWPSLA